MNPNGQSRRPSLDSTRKRIEHYSYLSQQKLGSGYSSQVFKGRDELSGKTIAVKVINMHKVRQKGLQSLLMNEVKLLKEMQHSNMIHCMDALMTNNNCYIFTDYCAEGDLAALIARRRRLNVGQALRVTLELAEVVGYLHRSGVIHRDIKPSNILMNKGRPKLADFGFAAECKSTIRDGFKVGTPLYMSPQALTEREYSCANDMWALGVTMFQMVEGCSPWKAKDQRELKEAIKGDFSFKFLTNPQIQQMIRSCLTIEKEKRLTADQLLTKLKSLPDLQEALQVQLQSNKQNMQDRNTKMQQKQVCEQYKKAFRLNYVVFKWLINYSRLSAKLLSKLEAMHLPQADKQPFTQFAARCTHMTISYLHRIDQYHQRIGITHYQPFKRTARFFKVRLITEQYHKQYFLMLSKLKYTYCLAPALALPIPLPLIDCLQRLPIHEQYSHSHLNIAEELLALVEANLLAKNNHPLIITQNINFEQLINNSHTAFNQQRIEALQTRQKWLLGELGYREKLPEPGSKK